MKKFFLSSITLCAAWIVCTGVADAQQISIPLDPTYDKQQTFAVDILMDSKGQAINAIEAYISYSSDTIEIQDIQAGDSSIDLWVSKPRVEKENHTIVLLGGIGGGAVMKDAPIATIIVSTTAAGNMSFDLDVGRSAVYLNNGQGTRIPLEAIDAHAVVTANTYQPPVFITSPTHPHEFTWYNASTALLAWEAHGVLDWSYALSTDPSDPVDTTPDQPIEQVQFQNVSDGIHYFVLRQRITGSEWTDPIFRAIRVDTTPPDPFQIKKIEHDELYNDATVLVFQATDATSGIAYYEVQEEENTYRVDRGPVQLRNPNGSYVKVTAYDYAGNRTVAELSTANQVSWLLIIVIGCIIVALMMCFFILRKKYQQTSKT